MAKKKSISDKEYDIEFYKSLSGEQALQERRYAGKAGVFSDIKQFKRRHLKV